MIKDHNIIIITFNSVLGCYYMFTLPFIFTVIESWGGFSTLTCPLYNGYQVIYPIILLPGKLECTMRIFTIIAVKINLNVQIMRIFVLLVSYP